MMTIKKHRSLLLAEAVFGMLAILIGEGEGLRECELVVSSANIGAQPGLMISDVLGGRVVWIFSRKNVTGIRVVLGERSNRGYDFDVVKLPNDDSEEYDFMEDEVAQAAASILKFFETPLNKTRVFR
jgi:hypothetical protein